MKIAALQPGDTVYSVEKIKMGNTSVSTVVVYSVVISEVHENHVVASWNGNRPKVFREPTIKKWKKEKPILISVGMGAKRLATKAEIAGLELS